MNLLDGIRNARAVSNEVLVALSLGKDSMVTLDLCAQHFDTVRAFFMYLVPGLSFQESYIEMVERRYDLKVLRLPHFGLSRLLHDSSLRLHTATTCPVLTPREVFDDARRHAGIEWIAGGERRTDSIERRAMIKPNGIDHTTKRFYPLANWHTKTVKAYMTHRRIPTAPDYSGLRRSWGDLTAPGLVWMRKYFPHDYSKVKALFPFVDAEILRAEIT